MKKYLLALAASLLSTFVYAVGAEGDIRSIQAVSVSNNWQVPMTVGEDVCVRVRLLNQDWMDALKPTPAVHEWVFERNTTPFPELGSDMRDVVYWPSLRLAIGARKVNAEFVYIGPNGEMSGVNAKNNFYTDLYFSYKVKEGDLGLPVRLVNVKDEIIEKASDIGNGFYLLNVKTEGLQTGYWNLTNDSASPKLASFWYGPTVPDPDPTTQRGYPDPDGEHMDCDKLYPGVNVKTIDFRGADADPWCQVYQGDSDKVVGSIAPAVSGYGDPTSSEPTTVYVWSQDESIVVPEGDTESVVHPDGVTRKVLKVTLPAKAAESEDIPVTVFKLRGADSATIGATTTIHLCSSKSPAVNGAGDVLAGSTLTRKVMVVEDKREPSIKIVDGENGYDTFTSTAKVDPADGTEVKIVLSKEYPTDLTVNLNYVAAEDYFKILPEGSNPTSGATPSITTIQIPAGEKTASFMLYPLGTTEDLKTTGVTITPAVNESAAAYFTGGLFPAVAKINDVKPTVEIVDPPSPITTGEEITLDVKVSDNWFDLTDGNTAGHKIRVRIDEQTVCEDTFHFKGDAEQSVTVSVPKTILSDTTTIEIQAKDSTHGESWGAISSYSVGVTNVSATPTVFETDSPTSAPVSVGVVEEGSKLNIRAVLTKPYAETIYAYLRPADAATEKLVACTDKGAEINTASATPLVSDLIALKLLDGDEKTPTETKVKLALVLTTKPEWTGDDADLVKAYGCKELSFVVSNVRPSAYSISRGDTTIRNGETITVASALRTSFTLKVEDPGFLDLRDTTKPVEVKWWFPAAENPQLAEQGDIVEYGKVEANPMSPEFGLAKSSKLIFDDEGAIYKGYVLLRDRDDPSYGDKSAWDVKTAAFSFFVKAGKEPTFTIEFPAERANGKYLENDNESVNYFTIGLTEYPASSDYYDDDDPVCTKDNPLCAELQLEEYNTDNGAILLTTNKNVPGSDKITLNFTKRGEKVKVFIESKSQNGGDDKDGSRFKVSARVTTDSRKKDGTKWSDYYVAAEVPETTYIRMANVAPELKLLPGDQHSFGVGVTNRWTAGETIALKWNVTDILHDLKSGNFTIEWDLADANNSFSHTVQEVDIKDDKVLKAQASGLYTFTVPDAPFVTVQVKANDGEGGISEVAEFYIQVARTKKIELNPIGPSTQSETRYINAMGLGSGHFYVVGSTGQYVARQFIQTWNYSESEKQAHVYAIGYHADSKPDDGDIFANVEGNSLCRKNGFIGAALGPRGYTATAEPYFGAGKKDYNGVNNFFYTWVTLSQEGEATVLPPVPAATRDTAADKTFLLDNEKPDEGTSYGTVFAQAIFAKEYRKDDMLGDINNDGIPDLVAKRYAIGGSREGEIPEDDLAAIGDENDDGDFLPVSSDFLFASTVPGIRDSWTKGIHAFTAKKELRGIHDGLNDAAANRIPGVYGVETYPNYASDDLELRKAARLANYSDAEYIAWSQTGFDPDWSPENPTNPTLVDTDGDGLEDGYEYYFWYWSHVGNVVVEDGKTNLVHLTGERYNPLHPEKGDLIPFTEIAKLFDPNSDYGQDKLHPDTIDTDNDGIPDYLEYELGTNPVHWDTDGDGLPDGWELYHSNLDPLKKQTDGAHDDGVTNNDGDFMAVMTLANQEIIGFERADGSTHLDFYSVRAASGRIAYEIKTAGERWLITSGGKEYFVLDENLELGDFYHADESGKTSSAGYLTRDFKWGTVCKADNHILRGESVELANFTSVDKEPTKVEMGERYLLDAIENTAETKYDDLIYGLFRNGARGDFIVYEHLQDGILLPNYKPIVFSTISSVKLIHHHVYQRRGFYFKEDELPEDGGLVLRKDMGTGFDPRTAWFIHPSHGTIGDRWRGTNNPTPNPHMTINVEAPKAIGQSFAQGAPVDTVGFSAYDEFMLLIWRWKTGQAGLNDITVKADNPSAKASKITDVWSANTTKAGVPKNKDGEAQPQASAADTDGDGVPDGWELYVAMGPANYPDADFNPPVNRLTNAPLQGSSYSPLNPKDATYPDWARNDLDPILGMETPDEKLGDGLSLAAEFRATDTCLAYADCPTIPENNGRWINKFLPTDPWSRDTDCDGLTDDAEGGIFIYDHPVDNGSHCIKGAGLNPCSWDTDFDGLPDPWEAQFSGMWVFKDPEHGDGGDPNYDKNLPVLVRRDYERHVAGNPADVNCFCGGMNGTVADSYSESEYSSKVRNINRDFDYDGLDPWQEYLTGLIRPFRYDDTLSPWVVPQKDDFKGTVGELLEALVTGTPLNPLYTGGSNPNLVFDAFDGWAAYGSLNRRGWDFNYDHWYYFPDGPNHCLRLEKGAYGTNAYDEQWKANGFGAEGDQSAAPDAYICTSPISKDTDNDGLDDFYELYHGINPLYGGDSGSDIVASAWGYSITAKKNFWTFKRWNEAKGNSNEAKRYDFSVFPWMSGDPSADPDGDDIRNIDESIQANAQIAQTYLHTDPSPLWMTDTSDPKSLVSGYYRLPLRGGDQAPDTALEALVGYEGKYLEPNKLETLHRWRALTYNWSFEENEGLDSDHDSLTDKQEGAMKSAMKSDPQNPNDPHRRQAMYFPGDQSALQAKTDPIYGLRNYEKFFLEFSVECWVRPDGPNGVSDQVILERTVDAGWSNPGDLHFYRRNFELGLTPKGYFYAAFDHNGTQADRIIARSETPAPVEKWSHLAATYDGNALVLYVNGEEVARQESALHPATPAQTIKTELTYSYVVDQLTWMRNIHTILNKMIQDHAIIFGASAVEDQTSDETALILNPKKSTWNAYEKFYKGWLDEVRIWDGALKSDVIAANFKKRFTTADIEQNRKQVYDAWKKGARRDVTGEGISKLPVELVYHYSFDGLFAADNPDAVATSAYGYTSDPEVGGKAKVSRPVDWVSPWWNSLGIHSLVYDDYGFLPIIPNTVAHLRRIDGTSNDSVYWSEDYSGFSPAAELNTGLSTNVFPQTHELYTATVPVETLGLAVQSTRISIIAGLESDPTEEQKSLYDFTRRSEAGYTTDLLPLGNAYVRYCTDFWDNDGPTTTWDVTGADDNNNLLADWWEALVLFGGQPELGVTYEVDAATLPLTADTELKRNGVTMTAMEAYRRDLAAGAAQIKVDDKLVANLVNGIYTQTVDTDQDGMPDWWEQMYGIDNHSVEDADIDFDGDGLSNFQEYLISEVLRYVPELNPKKAKSNNIHLDYLRKIGSLYLGEIFTDHDGMAGNWEKQYDPTFVNRYIYDPYDDKDQDGWSNLAEFRAGTDPTQTEKLSINGYILPEHPVPVVKATLSYNGNEAIVAPLVFMAWDEASDPDMTGAPDAIWTIGKMTEESAETGVTVGGAVSEEEIVDHEKFIGQKPKGEKTYYLTGGSVSEGSVKICVLDKGYALLRYLSYKDQTIGNRVDGMVAGEPDDARWFYKIYDRGGKLVMIGNSIDSEEEVDIGTIDYTTGRITIDFDHEELCGRAFAGPIEDSTAGGGNALPYEVYYYHVLDLDKSYIKIEWKTTSSMTSAVGTYYLADADKPTQAKRSRGYLREGKATFACVVDSDGDGKYTAGELYGLVRGVDIGWQGGEFEVEVTEANPIFARINISDGVSDRGVLWGADGGNAEAMSNDVVIAEEALSGGSKNHVRIIPYEIAGVPFEATDGVPYKECEFQLAMKMLEKTRVVAEFDLDVNNHPYIMEGDFIRDDKFDIDWDLCESEIINNSLVWDRVGDVTAIRYRLVLGKEGPLSPKDPTDTNTVVRAFSTLVERRFEPYASRTLPTELAIEGGQLLYRARPTFMWRLNESSAANGEVQSAALLGCSYTAFQIQVYSTDTNALVYDSGVRRAPIRNTKGVFSWTAPVCAGGQTDLGTIFSRSGNYKWRVAMYNAKFKPTEDEGLNGWSDFMTFATSVGQQQLVDDHGFGAIQTSVKYAGPSAVLGHMSDLGTTAGKVRVQAFASGDFSGTPAGEALVTDRASLADTAEDDVNATIYGLTPGEYYIRAYIDTNGNGVKDPWESWGYAAGKCIVAKAGRDCPKAIVVIDDADTDRDWLPDAWEMETYGDLDHDNATVDADGKIVLLSQTYDNILNGAVSLPKNFPATSFSFFRNFTAVQLLLGDTFNPKATDSIDNIRQLVERRVKEGTVKVSSFFATKKSVTFEVEAEVEDAALAPLLSAVYLLPEQRTVTLKVYRKDTLAQKNWNLVGTYPAVVSTAFAETVTIDIAQDLSSGFYKVEVVQD